MGQSFTAYHIMVYRLTMSKTTPALRAAQRRYDRRRPRLSVRLPHHTDPEEVKTAAGQAGYDSVSDYVQQAIDRLMTEHRKN